MDTSLAPQTNRGGSIEQIRKDVFSVPSFTDENTTYQVNLDELSCSCPAHQYGHVTPCKHTIVADCIASIPAGIGSSIAEREVTELCRRIFRKPENESYVESYRLLHEVLWCRWATSAMKVAAGKRHARIAESGRATWVSA